MLSDIRSYYGLTREISLTGQSTYFETTQSQHVVKELKLAIKDGKLIVLAGIVGTGKTTTLRKIQACDAQVDSASSHCASSN